MSCSRPFARPTMLIGLCWGLLGLAAPAVSSEDDPASASIPSPGRLIGQLKRDHPRLLVDEDGFRELRRRVKADPMLEAWDEQVRREADKILTAPLPRHVLPDGKRLLSTSRRVLGHSYTLSLTYRLHGDRRHLDRLWQ